VKTWSTPVRDGSKDFIPCGLCNGRVFKSALECEGFAYVRCVSCGLVQMNPQPVKNEIIDRYSNTFGGDYLSYEIENDAPFLKLQQLALKDTKFHALEKTLFARDGAARPPAVLDVGCATGSLLEYLAGRGWHVTGVEISPAAGYAREKRKLDVRSVPLEECKFEAGSFDIVLASHLIEHLNDPRSFLTETRRILKENGRVFITTPNISGFQARLYKGRWRSAIFDHLYLFSIRTLSKMLKSTGFKTERVRTWGGLASGLSPKCLKKPLDFLAKPLGFGDVMIIRAGKI
jgi:2-polyprenyl-3-methyl-5-hydroxy-6-metoxy-1,4-benzoquinol methylase